MHEEVAENRRLLSFKGDSLQLGKICEISDQAEPAVGKFTEIFLSVVSEMQRLKHERTYRISCRS